MGEEARSTLCGPICASVCQQLPGDKDIRKEPWNFPSVCALTSTATSLTRHDFLWLAFTCYHALNALLFSAGLVGGLKIV